MPTIGDIDVPGFPSCASCQLRRTATAATCYQCASSTLPPLPDQRCGICQQQRDHGQACRNRLCGSADRQFGHVTAIAPFNGDWHNKIIRYKYDGRWGWGHIFARLLVAYLDATINPSDYDLIVASPTYRVPDASHWTVPLGHAELVLSLAAGYDIDGRWPFDDAADPAITKRGPTDRNAGQGLIRRRANAAALRQVLHITRPHIVVDARVLVYDDVFTSGHTLNEIARSLRGSGASQVDGVVLARQIWQ
jgi:predicted amidophosphoribosyltransferase